MSVQRFAGRTTSSEEDFKKYSLSPESLLFLHGSDPVHTDFYSIDLTVGSGWSTTYSEHSRNLYALDGEIGIASGKSLVIELDEQIWIPHNRYGLIVPTGEIGLTHGLLFAPTKVEPNFRGRLKVRLFNTGVDKVRLVRGQRMASLLLFSTDEMVHQPEVQRPTEVSKLPMALPRRVVQKITATPLLWGPLATLLGALLVLFGRFLFG